jgi:hypothetical protein
MPIGNGMAFILVQHLDPTRDLIRLFRQVALDCVEAKLRAYRSHCGVSAAVEGPYTDSGEPEPNDSFLVILNAHSEVVPYLLHCRTRRLQDDGDGLSIP